MDFEHLCNQKSDIVFQIEEWECYEAIEAGEVLYWSPDDVDEMDVERAWNLSVQYHIPENYAEIINAVREQEWKQGIGEIMDYDEASLLDKMSVITPVIYQQFKEIYTKLSEAEIFSTEQFEAISELTTLLGAACESKEIVVADVIEAYQAYEVACSVGLK